MATTSQKATQLANADLRPAVQNPVVDDAKVRFARFDFKQSGAGAAGSTADLVKFGAGRIRIIPVLSYIKNSALGTSVTADIGYLGYTGIDGTAVSASADTILDGGDLAAAGATYMGTGTNAAPKADGILIESADDVVIQLKSTLPDAATLTGWIAYVRD